MSGEAQAAIARVRRCIEVDAVQIGVGCQRDVFENRAQLRQFGGRIFQRRAAF